MKVKLHIKNFDYQLNNIAKNRIKNIFKFKTNYKNQFKKIFNLNIFLNSVNKHRVTVLASPHVHKKSREQFELNVFKNIFNININIFFNINKFLWFKEISKFFLYYLNYKLSKIHNVKGIAGYLNSSNKLNFKKINKNTQLKVKLIWVKK